MHYQDLLAQIILLVIVINAFYYMTTGKFTWLGIDKMFKKIIKSMAESVIGLIESFFSWIGDKIANLISRIFRALTPVKNKDTHEEDKEA